MPPPAAPPPSPPAPPEGFSIPITPSISSGARPFVSACCSKAWPPLVLHHAGDVLYTQLLLS